MTVNKSQGQSLRNVGLLFHLRVFGHGQLYVALSRTTDPAGIRTVVPDTAEPVGRLDQERRLLRILYDRGERWHGSYSAARQLVRA